MIVLLQVEDDPLLLHDEPIFENGKHVGFTTSGGRGPRTGLDLAFALIDVAPGETLQQTCSRTFAIRVAGQDYPAKPLRRPPYDPDGERMNP